MEVIYGLSSEIAFSRDSQMLASGGKGKEILIWEVETGQQRLPADSRMDAGRPIAFMPDGKSLMATAADGLLFWDTSSLKETRSKAPGSHSVTSRLVGDGKILAEACRNQRVQFCDLATGTIVADFDPPRQNARQKMIEIQAIQALCVSEDGKTFVVGNAFATIGVYNVAKRERVSTIAFQEGKMISSMALSPDSKTLAAIVEDESRRGAGVVWLWDLESGKQLRKMEGSSFIEVAYTLNGRFLAALNKAGTVQLWEGESGKEAARLETKILEPTAMAFSPNNRHMAILGDDGLSIFEWTSGKKLGTFSESRTKAPFLVFSADGRKVAISMDNDTILIWDALRFDRR